MNKIKIASLGLMFIFLVSPLYAQEEGGEGEEETSIQTVEDASCQNTCPEGQVKITFADGNKVSCVCSEGSTGMVETVETTGACVDANDDGTCDEEV